MIRTILVLTLIALVFSVVVVASDVVEARQDDAVTDLEIMEEPDNRDSNAHHGHHHHHRHHHHHTCVT
jgi:hypothetical protein